jgi:maltose-binding protein MalE
LKFTYKITPTESTYDVASNLFKDGKAAFLINGPWSFTEYTKAGIDLGIARLPKIDGNYPQPYKGTKSLVVNVNLDKNKADIVKRFIEFVNLPGNQIELAQASKEVPTNIEARQDKRIVEDNQIKSLMDQMSVGIPMPIIPKMRAVWDGIRPIIKYVLGGSLSPNDAPREIQKNVEEKIKTMFGSYK